MKIIFPIAPFALERVRVNFRGKHPQLYTPTKSQRYKKSLGEFAQAIMVKENYKMFVDVPLCVDVVFFLKKPKSVKRRLPFVRPDLDNYLKAFLDGINGVVYFDDALVSKIIAGKFYSPTSEPYISMNIYAMS